MNDELFEALCLECARELAPKHDPVLPERVEAELWGGATYGLPGQMNFVADGTAVAGLLVATLSFGLSYLQYRRDAKGRVEVRGDVDAIEKRIDAELAGLELGQEKWARDLKQDVCAWLRSRISR